jgi:hypothetical protein
MVVAAVPDHEGKLSDLEKDRVVTWLSDHWKNANCPFHGSTQWEIGWAVGTQPFVGPGGGEPGSGPVVGGSSFPLALLTCAQCGFVVQINLIKVGLITMPPTSTAQVTPEAASEAKAD